MEITSQLISDRYKIIDELSVIARHHEDAEQYPCFVEFLQNYMTTLCLEEWLGRELNDL